MAEIKSIKYKDLNQPGSCKGLVGSNEFGGEDWSDGSD